MIISPETLQQLTALIGRVEALEQKEVDLSQHALLSYVNNVVPVAEGAKVVSLSEDLIVKSTDPSLIVAHGNYEGRTITLPKPNKSGKMYIIINNGA